MKRIFCLVFLMATGIFLAAQVPEFFNYQAIVRNVAGQPIVSQPVSVLFTIYKTTPAGTNVYSEKHSPTTNEFGLVNLAIGNGSDKTGSFTTIDWGADSYYLNVKIDPAGGTSYTDMGTIQFLSVPYAMHAKTTETFSETDPVFLAWDKDYSDLTNQPDLGVYATKAYVDALEDKLMQLQAEVGVTDIDGNHYKAVKLGTQVWMADNLKVTKYRDGAEIALVTINEDWAMLAGPAYCWYGNNETNKDIYGALYNWFAASSVNLCPSGWHVPSDVEWEILVNYLITNGYNYDGSTTGNKIAKALASASGWTSSTVEGSVGNSDYSEKRNVTKFSAPAGGYRYTSGGFYNSGNFGIWWSSSGYNETMAWKRLMKYDNTDVNWSLTEKIQGCSVRCIKD